VLVFVCVCGSPAQSQTKLLGPDALLHKPAPQFVRTDLAGQRLSLKAYRGKVVLLNFWATWCGPCRLELPKFAQWQRQFGPRGLQVIAVSMDDGEAPVRSFVRTLKPGFPVLMGDVKLARTYGGILGLPVTYLIGRDGRIFARVEGGADLPAMEREVKNLLALPTQRK
jgi:thiol-disulfide isomerase/thioredoxin